MAITLEGASKSTQLQSTSASQTGSLNKHPVMHLETAVARRGFNAGGDGAVICVCKTISASILGIGFSIGTCLATAAVAIATRNVTKSLMTFTAGLLLTVVVMFATATSK